MNIPLENYEKSPWINSEDEIYNAPIGSLLRAILTHDGKGRKFKEKDLIELFNREKEITMAIDCADDIERRLKEAKII